MATTEAVRTHLVEVTVNGEQRSAEVEARLLLVHFVRETLGLTGTHIGCDTTSCGACTVLVDGVPDEVLHHVRRPGRQGSELTTVEGLLQGGAHHPIQEGFHEEHGLQCGFCTPGMMLTSVALLAENPSPTRRGDPLGALRPDLPLHGVPEHRQGGAACGGRNEGGVGDGDPGSRKASATPSSARRTSASSVARASTSRT